MRPGLPLLVAVLLATPPVVGKESSASCAAMGGFVERLQGAMMLASFHRARGSALAAYEALRTTAASVVREGAACGVVPALLERALARAAAADTAGAASFELDLGYVAALTTTMTGRLPPEDMGGKVLEVPESAEYGERCPDLFRIVRGLSDGGPALRERTSAVLADLRVGRRCPQVVRLLEAARADGLEHAVDSLRLDESDGSGAAPLARCPELPLMIERLASAINRGAPLFNRGDHEACRRVYDTAARALRDDLIPPGRCPVARRELDGALATAGSAASASEAAWALRRAFDRVLALVRPGSP